MRHALVLASVLLALAAAPSAHAQTLLGGDWTYQGRLDVGGVPVNDSADLRFRLYDAQLLGSQVGSTITLMDVDVVDGVFTVDLDFGVEVFDGNARWLQVSVRSPHDPGNTGAYTTLSPRQAMRASPYAIQTRGIFVDDARNVGVGTGNPQEKLHVNGNVRVDGWIGTDVDQDVELAVNGSTALQLRHEEYDDNTGFKPAPSIIGGSPSNRILSGAVGSIIAGGGYEESNGVGNYISDSFCAILGGRDNQAGDNIVGIREQYATCVGGYRNFAGSDYSFIGGGFDNVAVGDGSAVVGGMENEAAGGPNNFIGGGYRNDMVGSFGSNSYSVIAGGRENVTQAQYATVPGGYLNYAGGNYSFAAGRRAKANDTGSFVWGDSLNADFGSTAPDQFLVRARGGMGLNTSTPLSPLHVSNWVLGFDSSSIRNDDIVVESDDSIIGLYSTGSGSWGSGLMLAEVDGTGMLLDKWALVRQSSGAASRLHLTYGSDPSYSLNPRIMSFNTTGQVGIGITPFFPLHMASGAHCTVGGTWTNASSRALKENITPVDRREVLGRVLDLPVSRWNYRAEGDSVEHIGPMAEDFARAFALGQGDDSIATVDADGIALASIQALHEIIEEKEAEIEALRRQNEELDARLARIERLLTRGNGAE